MLEFLVNSFLSLESAFTLFPPHVYASMRIFVAAEIKHLLKQTMNNIRSSESIKFIFCGRQIIPIKRKSVCIEAYGLHLERRYIQMFWGLIGSQLVDNVSQLERLANTTYSARWFSTYEARYLWFDALSLPTITMSNRDPSFHK